MSKPTMEDTGIIDMDDLRDTVDAPFTCLNSRCRHETVIKNLAKRPSKALDLECEKCGSNFFHIIIGNHIVTMYGEVKNAKRKR